MVSLLQFLTELSRVTETMCLWRSAKHGLCKSGNVPIPLLRTFHVTNDEELTDRLHVGFFKPFWLPSTENILWKPQAAKIWIGKRSLIFP